MIGPKEIAEFIRHSSGRGFWVGLFPRLPSAALEAAQNSMFEHTNDGADLDEIKNASDLHVTLFHFGKNVPSRVIEQVCVACDVVAQSTFAPQELKIEGGIRLPNHVGLLVAPKSVLRIRENLLGALRDRDVRPDERFEGVPHITLWKLKYAPQSVAHIPLVRPFSVAVDGITVVAGDCRATVAFEPSPF